MKIELNHTIVPAKNKEKSAKFLANLFDLEVGNQSPGSPIGHFAVIKVGNVFLDFFEIEKFEFHHYAFLINENDFETVFTKIKELGISYSADPKFERIGEIDYWNGGPRVYFKELNGHNIELITRTL